jgi:DNA helicase-2/ATP-dependent DNA helicase PcrA
VSNILQFKERYKNAKEVFLTTNYRSKQNILDLSYDFIQLNNPDRLEYKMKISKKLAAVKKGKGEIVHIEALDSEDETKQVVKKIINLVNNKKVDSLNDIAILVRSNDTAKVFMTALTDAEIDYQFVASRGLFRKPIIVDIVSYFKLLDNYHESTALFRVLSWEIMKISPEDIAKLTHVARRKQWALFYTISHYHGHTHIAERTKKLLFKLVRLIEKHTELAKTRSPQQLFIQVLIDFGIQKHLNEKPNYTNYLKLWQLQQFFKEIVDFAASEDDPHLKDFMEYFNYLLESGEQGGLPSLGDEGPEAVSIMTIHASKGLEFEYVFIPKLIDKTFPSISRRDPIEIPEPLIREILPEGDVHTQEERRLFYVACTRAKTGLYFSTAKDYGGKTVRKPSQFLIETGLVKKLEKKKAKKPTGVVDFTKRETLKKKKEAGSEVWSPPLPAKFSFSQFRAFETCPWQYRYAFLLKIPVPGKASFSFGQSMHNTLYQAYILAKERQGTRVANLFEQKPKKSDKTLGDLIDFKEIKNLYESSWQTDWFDSTEEQNRYKKSGLEQLKAIYEKEKKNKELPLALEEGFTLKLKNAIVKGRIDRMDETKEGVEIIDYKTGTVKEKLTKDDKLQLLIYQMALAKENRFKDKIFTLSYYYLTNASKASFTATDKELEDAENKLVELVDEMRATDFKAKPSQFICANCDYKDICPFKE